MKEIINILLEIKHELALSYIHNKELLSLREFSLYADISIEQCYKLTSEHKIKFYRPGGRKIYIEREDAVAYLKQNPVDSLSTTERKTNQYFLNAKTVA